MIKPLLEIRRTINGWIVEIPGQEVTVTEGSGVDTWVSVYESDWGFYVKELEDGIQVSVRKPR